MSNCKKCGGLITPGSACRNAASEPHSAMPYCSEDCALATYSVDSMNSTRKIVAELENRPAPQKIKHRKL